MRPSKPLLIAATSAAGAALVATRAAKRARPAETLIVSQPRSTVIADDGAVRSVQSARIALSEADLDRLWTPANLENLGATYWQFLSTATFGIVRVLYGSDDRRVTILGIRALTLLRFEMAAEHGRVSWQIQDGLLVAARGRGQGWLSLDVKRVDPVTGLPGPVTGSEAPAGSGVLSIEVEVANFYPAIASWLGAFVYQVTQSFVHVLVTHAFLRSLSTLELTQSRVAQLAP